MSEAAAVGGSRECLRSVIHLLRTQPIRSVRMVCVRGSRRGGEREPLRLVLCVAGERTAIALAGDREEEATAGPGDVVVHDRHTHLRAEYRRAEPTRTISVVLYPDVVRVLDVRCEPQPDRLPAARGRPAYVFETSSAELWPAMRGCLEALERCDGKESEGYRVRLAANIFEDVVRLMACGGAEASATPMTFLKMREFIDEHFADSISRDDVAEAVGVHPNSVSRLFREQSGESFAAYLARRRVNYAATLLRETNLSIKEIAASTAMGHPSNLYRHFRERFGCGPLEYRGRCD